MRRKPWRPAFSAGPPGASLATTRAPPVSITWVMPISAWITRPFSISSGTICLMRSIGDSKTDARVLTGLRGNRYAHPDHSCLRIEQRPARVARVHRGIGLDERLHHVVLNPARQFAVEAGDDAGGECAVPAERIAQGVNPHARRASGLRCPAESDRAPRPGLQSLGRRCLGPCLFQPTRLRRCDWLKG